MIPLKSRIHLITGFLSSGKTTLIKRLLSSKTLKDKRGLILLFEEGEEEINPEEEGVILFPEKRLPEEEEFLAIIETYNPQYILLEYNGMLEIEELLQFLERKKIRERVSLGKILTTVDPLTLTHFTENLGPLFLEPLIIADTIILKNPKALSQEEKISARREIKSINREASIVEEEKEDPLERGPSLRLSLEKGLSYLLLYGSVLFLFLLLRISAMGGMIEARYQSLFAFTTIFISILLQATPFILIGVIISASIQVFVSQDFIISLFHRNTPLSMVIALFAGVFFPICDCAIIPVMSRLVKKGIPLPAAITFMMAAPIVDPVVIASTFYAFPTMPFIGFSRLFLGLTIALLTGLYFHISPPKGDILKSGSSMMTGCSCGYCTDLSTSSRESKRPLSRLLGVLDHAGGEFFHVGQFLIIAAACSALIQTFLPQRVFSIVTANPVGALFTMMAFAFILSICSTSDAFIARNFYGQFTTGPVVGFMVFGAVIDMKNLFLLLGHFDQSFVRRLLFRIITIAGVVLLIYSLVL